MSPDLDQPSLHVAERGAGPPVLLVHGQPGVGGDWTMVADRLAADYLCLAPDRPGYGETALEATSMAANAALLAEVVEKGPPAIVVGHSYGGGLAVLLAAARPELVRGLVLVSSVGTADSVNGVDHLLALPGIGEVLSTAALVTFGQVLPRLRPLASLLPGRASVRLRAGLPDDQYVTGITRRRWRTCRSFVSEQRSLLAEIADVEDALERVHVPTTVVAGTLDAIVPPPVSAAVAAKVAGAELVLVAGAGHLLPRDHPSVVAAAVRRVDAR